MARVFRWRWLAVAGAVALVGPGCTPLPPWSRGRLATWAMAPGGAEAARGFENKVFAVSEAAGGGEADAVGGGCGCS